MRIKRLKLKKLNNTRDLGGMPAADGRAIKGGKLIRSGKLSNLPDKTISALKEIGVSTVVDLRVPAEKNQRPDVNLEGVNYVWLPLIYTPAVGVTDEVSTRITAKKESYRIKEEFGSVDNYMVETYRSMLFNEEPQNRLKEFLRLVIEEEGCILWHCSSGKDRAGVCSMLVESLLGVSEEVILQDYIASRKFWRKRYNLNRLALIIAPVTIRFKLILFGFMRTKIKYLKTAMDECKSRYGSVIGYCKQVLDITEEDIKTLRLKYLE